jgi:uncharacterized membrane protein
MVPPPHRAWRLRASPLPAAAVAAGAATWALAESGWHSPVRSALALLYLLLGPGVAVTDLLGIEEVALRLSLSFAASVAVDTLVAVTLIYAGAFTTASALGVLVLITAAAAAAGQWVPGRR